MKTRYKFLRSVDGKIKSQHGDCEWRLGEWKHEDKIEMCDAGFHCSKKVYEAFSYVQGEILAKVEVKGHCEEDDDKDVFSDMRIIKTWKWEKKDSVALSIFAAELVLDNFEKQYPNDDRPRKAIEAAKKVLENDTEENRSAARYAAESARYASESAALSAKSAALSARSAAESAAWSARYAAESAAWSARSARYAAESARYASESAAWSARSAAWSALIKNIDKWMTNRIKELDKITN